MNTRRTPSHSLGESESEEARHRDRLFAEWRVSGEKDLIASMSLA